jgi:glycosyltransferase involved in cell wall biosynthesis
MGCSIATLWSKKQSVTYSTEFDLPVELFIFIPYKATHSKVKQLDLPVLDFVFSGGNGKRDYASLVEAVRGTKVTLVISATRPEVLKTIGDEPNIIPLAASEPSYSKLMASSRFVVVPMVSTGLKGGGETNYCNAMWHSKAVIAMDEMSADDYIIEGKSGYIVPHRDVVQLKKRILELWNDKEKSEKMGAIGKTMADKCFTQVLGIRRLVRLACLLGKERIIDRNERL